MSWFLMQKDVTAYLQKTRPVNSMERLAVSRPTVAYLGCDLHVLWEGVSTVYMVPGCQGT